MTIKEAASHWRVTEKTVRRWIEKGAIAAHKPCKESRKLLIQREDANRSEEKAKI